MDEFTRELWKRMDEAEALGCRMVKFRQTVTKYGGVETAKEYLRKNRYSDGFDGLEAKKRLDLSMEALVTKGRFSALFTDDEVNRCFDRLCGAGYYIWKE